MPGDGSNEGGKRLGGGSNATLGEGGGVVGIGAGNGVGAGAKGVVVTTVPTGGDVGVRGTGGVLGKDEGGTEPGGGVVTTVVVVEPGGVVMTVVAAGG